MAVGLGVFVLALDAMTKFVVHNDVRLHYYPVIDRFLTIEYATNEGIAFGLFHDMESSWKTPLLSAMAVLALVLVVYYVWTTPPHERLVFLALGLLLGGIAGNFLDRIQDSSVVDFVKVHWGARFAWPTFNVADSAITTGVLLILVCTLSGIYSSGRPEEPSTPVD